MSNKRLPIIVFLDEHTDHIVQKEYVTIFEHLHRMGYSTLCQEFSAAKGVVGLQNFLEQELIKSSILLDEILRMLNHADPRECNGLLAKMYPTGPPFTAAKILSLNLIKLGELLACYVPQVRERKIPDNILRMRARAQWLTNLELFAKTMAIHTIDSSIEHNYSKPEHLEIDRRNQDMTANLVHLYSAGANIIFAVGKFHFPGVANYLNDEGLLNHTIFVDMNSRGSALDCGMMTTQSSILHASTHINEFWFNLLQNYLKAPDNPALSFRIPATKITSLFIDNVDLMPLATIDALIQTNNLSLVNAQCSAHQSPLLFSNYKSEHPRRCALLAESYMVDNVVNSDLLEMWTMLYIFLLSMIAIEIGRATRKCIYAHTP